MRRPNKLFHPATALPGTEATANAAYKLRLMVPNTISGMTEYVKKSIQKATVSLHSTSFPDDDALTHGTA